MTNSLEREFSKPESKQTEKEVEITKTKENMFSKVLGEKDYEKPLNQDLKNEIQWLIEMLQDFYDKKIAPSDAKFIDAVDYIPLFCINGALISSMMGIAYEDYLKLVDIMIVILGIHEE